MKPIATLRISRHGGIYEYGLDLDCMNTDTLDEFISMCNMIGVGEHKLQVLCPPEPAPKSVSGPGGVIELRPAYGIIDPDYARVFTIARCVAWSYGYALCMHGSFTRDLDLVAIPWVDTACKPEHLIHQIKWRTGLSSKDEPTVKPHGRLAWSLMFEGNDPRWIDISIMNRIEDDRDSKTN